MQRLFIADLHLSPNAQNEKSDEYSSSDNPLQRIINNNQDLINSTEEIYFLGDIFEYWLGIDHAEIHYHNELNTIKQLTQQKKCFFMRGNRDVLFSQADAEALNLTFLDDPYRLSIKSQNQQSTTILLTHGDAWTNRTLDRWYRQLSLSSTLRKYIRKLNINTRIKIATSLRKQSRGNQQQDDIKQPNPQHINQHIHDSYTLNDFSNFEHFAQTHSYQYIICGHFHRPGKYRTQTGTLIHQLGNLRQIDTTPSIYTVLIDDLCSQPTLKLLSSA